MISERFREDTNMRDRLCTRLAIPEIDVELVKVQQEDTACGRR